jgi:hypothetical protein
MVEQRRRCGVEYKSYAGGKRKEEEERKARVRTKYNPFSSIVPRTGKLFPERFPNERFPKRTPDPRSLNENPNPPSNLDPPSQPQSTISTSILRTP